MQANSILSTRIRGFPRAWTFIAARSWLAGIRGRRAAPDEARGSKARGSGGRPSARESRVRGLDASAWIAALPLSAAAFLGVGCASVKRYHAEPLARVSVENTQHAGDPDVELSIARLPPETVLRVLGTHGERLARSATILEVRISAGASPVPVSKNSFKLRLPGGAAEPPLETRWVLAAMNLPRIGGDGGSSGSGTWPPEGAIDIDSPEGAVFWLGLLAPVVVVSAASRALRESYAEHASADVWMKTMLPRVVEPGESVDLLLVFWPKTGGIPKEGRVPLEVRFELERCTWQSELEIPMN